MTKREPACEPKPEPRRVVLGDTLFRCTGRARDQADPVPGTRRRELAASCELVVSDSALYLQYINGAPSSGWRPMGSLRR